jgi:molecular chaperone HtpG
MDGQLDSHFIGLLEQKIEKSHFVRVDADILDNLIRKDDKKNVELTTLQRNTLSTLFQSQLPTVDGANFIVSFEALTENDNPVLITQNEYMRRMKEMAAMQPGMNFYGELPDSYNLIVNTEQPLIKRIINASDNALTAIVEPLHIEIETKNDEISKLRDSKEDSDKTKTLELEKEVGVLREKMSKEISEYASTQPLVKQLIDLALLGNGLLKGAQLSDFIRRSVELL